MSPIASATVRRIKLSNSQCQLCIRVDLANLLWHHVDGFSMDEVRMSRLPWSLSLMIYDAFFRIERYSMLVEELR